MTRKKKQRNGDIHKYPVINKNIPLSTCHIVKGKIYFNQPTQHIYLSLANSSEDNFTAP